MSMNKFFYPIDCYTFTTELIESFDERDIARESIRELEIDPVLEQLQSLKALSLEKHAIGLTMVNFIMSSNQDKIEQLHREYYKDRPRELPSLGKRKASEEVEKEKNKKPKISHNSLLKELEAIVSKPSALQRELLQQRDEKLDLFNGLTASEQAVLNVLNKNNSKKIDYCEYGTREKCAAVHMGILCDKVHFRRVIKPHTDISLGNCSYLDTCRHMEYCKFIHYELETKEKPLESVRELISESKQGLQPAQWVCVDIRDFDLRILGKHDVIMCDPPWDIHMSLPYGTLKDKEMKNLRIDLLQDHGLIFLWVTGRAMELGRECMAIWGYRKIEEIIWVKTNQLQRIIRTGRTGHWLNHSKEHCLVGIKGNPKINLNIDCDVIVSEVRETSRKPDEIYGLIERMLPGGRKIELFGRPHNCRRGWMTLGNQLPGLYLIDQDTRHRYSEVYPEVDISEEAMERNRQVMLDPNKLNEIYYSHLQNNKMIKGPE